MSSPDDERAPGLRSQLAVFAQRKWIVIGTIVVAVGLTAAYTFSKTKEYQATSTLELTSQLPSSILQANNSSSTSVAATVDVPTAIQVIESSTVQKAVESQVPGAPAVSASQVGTTDVVQLSVRAINPTVAANAANAYATQYITIERNASTASLQAAISKLRASASATNAQITVLENELAHTAAGAESDNLNAEVGAAQQTSLSEREQLSEYQTALAITTGGGSIIGRAVPPSSPVVPKPPQYLIAALILGAVLGGALALLVDRLDDRVRLASDIEGLLGDVPLIGRVPTIQRGNAARRASVTLDDPRSAVAESYRQVRTIIQYVTSKKSVVRIEVTSPQRGDGKTLTTANLAMAFALAGRKVLIVDCDLRLPQVHDVFGVPRGPGLSDLVLNRVEFDQVVHTVPASPNLRIVTAGTETPLPAEFLSSRAAREIFDYLGEEVEFLFFDTPPVNAVSDASALVPSSDYALVVVSTGKTTKRELSNALDSLRQVNAKIIGCVLNRVSRRDLSTDAYGYESSTRSSVDSPSALHQSSPDASAMSEGSLVKQDVADAE